MALVDMAQLDFFKMGKAQVGLSLLLFVWLSYRSASFQLFTLSWWSVFKWYGSAWLL